MKDSKRSTAPESITYEFVEIQQRLDALFKDADDAYDRVAKAQGVSYSVQDILYALCIYGEGLTQAQICAYSYSNKQTINSAIHRLVDRGVVRLAAGNGRSTRVYLTDRGRALARRVAIPIAQAEQTAIESLPAGQRDTFIRLLGRYVDVLTRELGHVASTRDSGHSRER